MKPKKKRRIPAGEAVVMSLAASVIAFVAGSFLNAAIAVTAAIVAAVITMGGYIIAAVNACHPED